MLIEILVISCHACHQRNVIRYSKTATAYSQLTLSVETRFVDPNSAFEDENGTGENAKIDGDRSDSTSDKATLFRAASEPRCWHSG